MRKLLLVFGVLAFAVSAWATITLNSSQVRSYSKGGTVTETDSVASVVSTTWNYERGTIDVVVNYGSVGANGFAAGRHAPTTMITVNANSGEVISNTGTIQLTPAEVQGIITTMKNQQNTVENALIGWGILQGTQVAN